MANMRNIALVGFMGTGKTSVGKALATKLGMVFVDMDDLISSREGTTVNEIFAKKGEPHFRALERDLVNELSARSGLVIGCGGGVVLNPANITDFGKTGMVACLMAEPGAILERLKDDDSRPLLKGSDRLEKITSILESRRKLYEAIPLRIDTTGLSVEAVTDKIASEYAKSAK